MHVRACVCVCARARARVWWGGGFGWAGVSMRECVRALVAEDKDIHCLYLRNDDIAKTLSSLGVKTEDKRRQSFHIGNTCDNLYFPVSHKHGDVTSIFLPVFNARLAKLTQACDYAK